MAEQVNRRIENMINELEQMRRTGLYNEEEIRQIARKRKEFEYRVQRRIKEKDDYVQYIAYELALLEDISLRRKKIKLTEKKKDLEYAVAKRLNRIFKQFIYRFTNDLEIYFQYIKFCMSVGFDYAVSAIIGQMLQLHGDKPKVWQLASKWEIEEQKHLESGREFLLKGIHRHPDSSTLYLDLFKLELQLAFKAKSDEDKEKYLNRADVVWKNGAKNITDIQFIFKLFDLSSKCDIAKEITEKIRNEIWSRRNVKDVWPYIASKELEDCHWEEIEEYADDNDEFPKIINYVVGIYEEALHQFPDKILCTKYIHHLLGLSSSSCSDEQKISAVKNAWMYGHENGLLTDEMYAFGLNFLKLEGEADSDDMKKILEVAIKNNPKSKSLWEEKLLQCNGDEKKMFVVLQEATKVLTMSDSLSLWDLMMENVKAISTIMNLYKKFQNCESFQVLNVKPKLLQMMYEHNGLKLARDLYQDFIRTPPTQVEVHKTMIEIEKSQENLNLKNIRKCYDCLVQHHGADNIDAWNEYMKFETENGNAHLSPAIYRRAVATLKKELVDKFIVAQTLAKLK